MNNIEILDVTEDQKLILKYTIELYIETGLPISSQSIIDRYDVGFSSAKVRYLMNDLEEKGFLEKTHISSGRVPSIKGYDFYARYLTKDDIEQLKSKMKDIFAKRRVSIDKTITEVADLLADAVGVTLITTETNENATLKHLQLVPISENEGTIILVNSYGETTSKIIKIDLEKVSMNDLRIAIRIFKERLIDTPLIKLVESANALKPILASSIKNYEALLEEFATQIFEFQFVNKNTIYGKDNIILANEISRPDLLKILDTIENRSIWETIESDMDDNENLKIAICDDHSTFITKKIENAKFKEISLVGSNRMNYAKGITALELFDELIQNSNQKK